MTTETIKKLNQLNKDFYDKTAESFNSSRQYYWDGWDGLWDFIISNNISIQSILDIGCGNGRFYRYLQDKITSLCHAGAEVREGSILENKFSYLGLDNNEYLLDVAKDIEFNMEFSPKPEFQQFDLMKFVADRYISPLPENNDLITLFGVMHHVPGYENRINLLKNLKESLSDDGIICVSLWKFLDDDKEKGKVMNNDKLIMNNVGVWETELEENDFVLSWNRGVEAFRYCHYVSEKEEAGLLSESGLKLVKEYFSDGKSGNLNKYLVLSK